MRAENTKPEDILDEENPGDEAAPEEPGHPAADSAAPDMDGGQDAPVGGEAILEDSIPLEEKLDLIKAALETSEVKATEYLDGWQRARAEFSNYKKRINREQAQTKKDAVGKVVRQYLPVVDDLERALKDRPPNGDGAAWAEGIELIYRKLMALLEGESVTSIQADGEMFDPNLHEAIAQTESDEHESGQIIEVIQTGYSIGDRVLRPARVRIAA
ncbi:MAG: nucleotide exchange factor GrpE [Chloroflexi bacterium]|nr:nucleotide exchange factor GrpE [Chloroflexota bacterium]MBU1660874.1 nucleotide exchange factor GrpE [Chloroflexota bacterium]